MSVSEPEQRGVVAVIPVDGRLLVIRRSQYVVAPGAFCFPGGAIEAGESEQEALIRELREELDAGVKPIRRLWESTTPWKVRLAWWLTELIEPTPLRPNHAEVESIHWFDPTELARLDNLLTSNRDFLAAWPGSW